MTASRRDFLKTAALLAGGTAMTGVVPEAVQRAFAIEAQPGTTFENAEHIVILMQENRSFDHALGTLQGVRGFNDPRAMRQPNGNSSFLQTEQSTGNTYAPWRLDIKDTKITWMGSIPHSRNSQVDAWNDGHHDNWIDAKRAHNPDYAHVPMTMGHYTREDLPFYYALADAFTVCDQSYCAAMTSTTPNRLFYWTGTVRDQQTPNSRVYMRNEEIMVGGMTWKTFPERLHEAGVSWKFYQNDLTRTSGLTKEEEAWLGNFGTNVLEAFSAYNISAYPYAAANLQAALDAIQAAIPKTQKALAKASGPQAKNLQIKLAKQQSDAEALKQQLAQHGKELYDSFTPQQKSLHDAAFVTNVNDPHYRSIEPLEFAGGTMTVPKGDVLHQFRDDVKTGKLPTISWLSSPENFSDHPVSPWYGAWYVSEVMDILTQNPEVWKKTIFILTYDENDGYFDHAPSFVAADPKRPETGGASSGISTALDYTYAQEEMDRGISPEESRSGPIGMGFRVPTIVASPWSRGGYVNSQLFDHTSTIMFLEKFVKAKTGKDVRETNITEWRRSIAGDLTSCFRPVKENDAKLDYLDRDKFVVSIREAKDKEMPANFKALTPDQIADINEKKSRSAFMSKQEPGTRPANALPYELYADAAVHGDKIVVSMKAGNTVHGTRAIGAPFNIYLRRTVDNKPEMLAATYAVKAGDTMTQEFPLTWFNNGAYKIDIHGPNGFYRAFRFGPKESVLDITTKYHPTGDITFNVTNTSADPITVTLKDYSYGTPNEQKPVAPHATTTFTVSAAQRHGWYDHILLAEGKSSAVHYAGRVETGKTSITDPAMAGA